MFSPTKSSAFVIILSLSTLITAWLPEEQKELLSTTGTNLFNTTTFDAPTRRWLPASGKIRGVNLGSLFVFEPWMASQTWTSMGCSGTESEFDCVSRLGQTRADEVFKNHWDTWITQADIRKMQEYGLNTIRIPVGYWMLEEIVYESEHFPRGAVAYLERVCGWASDAGFYIIIDMHGAPGAQIPKNSFTGQYAPTAGFYVDWQYARGKKFLVWLTKLIHSKNAFRNVGMIGLVNEPLQNADTVWTMRQQFYPQAYAEIRAAERAAGITSNNFLHIQVMNELWGAGNPNEFMTDRTFLAYEDHRYPKWDSAVEPNQQSYLRDSCTNNRARDNLGGPTVVSEWSISPADRVESSSDFDYNNQKAFYSRWFAAQVNRYERDTVGWTFWSWKTELSADYRWSYKQSVEAGVIPASFANLNTGACNGF